MSILKIIIFSLLVGLTIGCSKTDNQILNKTITNLNSIETIEYNIVTHYLQNEIGISRIDTAQCFFDFTSKDSLLGAKYHFVSKYGEQVFNGVQEFSSDNNEERVLFTNQPEKRNLTSSIFMMNSIYEIKKLLPIFINDTSISITRLKDTLINETDNYNFKISIHDRYITTGAEFVESKGYTSIYYLFISKKNQLPTQITNVFSENKGHWKASFAQIKLSVSRHDSIWNYDRLPQNFLRLSYNDFFESMKVKQSLKIGQLAPDWKLPLIGGDSVSIYDLKENTVLLEFWFPYCGGCLKAIPKINEIHKQYSSKALKVIGIEFTQSNDKGLTEYILKQNIQYPTLHSGKEVAKDYGINAAPTFFLINKKGLIVYISIGLDHKELLEAIRKNI